jgi:acetolactate synthase I/II/III large subunit
MKVSDYITQFLVNNGIRHLFLISGGGMMHMLDSAGKQQDLECIYNLNEQSSGICAESYGQFTNHLGACMLTTGPGATNALTGCAGAWLDSTPVIYISGQCRTQQIGHLRGLRQYGAQEVAIVPMVKPITKYAVTVMDKSTIRYHLEKAVYLATHGRRGPVWIDVPLDVQGADINVDELESFCAETEGLKEDYSVSKEQIGRIVSLFNESKRPALLIGHGVIGAGIAGQIRALVNEYRIPVLATWRAKGVFGDEEDLFMGSPGIPATRYSNYVLQNTDFLLVLGTRLNPAITAYKEESFAQNAKKIIVDIDKNEIEKLSIPFEIAVCTHLSAFMDAFLEQKDKLLVKDREPWFSYCRKVKARYPLNKEVQPFNDESRTDGYLFANVLSQYSKDTDVFVGSSSGRTCGISHMAYNLKQNQKFITSMGIGAMGWCIPSAIASCVASGRKRTLVFEGDGSLQHNLQELALINTYKLPVKIFVWSNEGYASIFTMQRTNFNSRFAGCDKNSGLGLPELKSIADTYKLQFYKIRNNSEIEDVIRNVMADDLPVLCEVCGSKEFDEIPKSQTIANPDGTFTSSDLINMYPFLPEEEVTENMPCWE